MYVNMWVCMHTFVQDSGKFQALAVSVLVRNFTHIVSVYSTVDLW